MTHSKRTPAGKVKKKKERKPEGENRSPSSVNNPSNKRSDHRIPIQLLVDYKANGHYLFDFCKDLGTGGVFIQTKAPLPMGSAIDLTFTIPDSKETLQTTGEVIWVQSEVTDRKDLTPGMGVQFAEFGKDQRKILQQFVDRYHGNKLTPIRTTPKSA